MRDELLDGEIFTTLEEATVLINEWRRKYNQVRPHSALGNSSPEEFARVKDLVGQNARRVSLQLVHERGHLQMLGALTLLVEHLLGAGRAERDLMKS